MHIYCLADFFNLDLWPSGTAPSFSDIDSGLRILTEEILKMVCNRGADPDEITLRLYGGWHGDLPDSGIHLLNITATAIRMFPRRVGTRLRIQIADAPIWEPSLRMINSVRKLPLRPLVGDISIPELCVDKNNCTVPSLQSWWKGRCPDSNCSMRIRDIGFNYRQKMVDTLLTADAITLVRDEICDGIVFASDDDDMIPAMLAVSSLNIPTFSMRRKQRSDTYYDRALDDNNVITHKW